MKNEGRIDKFIKYFSENLTTDRIDYLNLINSVIPEKVELYRDFTISLINIVNDTYLGDDVITEDQYVINHFNWCWQLNIKNFNTEKIFITESGDHYNYYLNYFKDVYYTDIDKGDVLVNKIISFWELVFSLTKEKTKSDYDIFIEVYKILDKSFNNALD